MNNQLTTMSTTKAISLVPQDLGQALTFAEALSRSTIIPNDYQKNPGNILVAMLQGMELGLGPLQALQGIAVINGRPALWGDALLAVVQGSGLLEKFIETQTDVSATCTVKRRGMPEEVTVTFTKEDAITAGLWNKKGYNGKPTPWVNYPKRMMQMRARSWALRDTFADVLRGIRTAEEERDIMIADGADVRVLPMAPDEPLALNAAPVEAEVVNEPGVNKDQLMLVKQLVRDLKLTSEQAADLVYERYQNRLKELTYSQAEDLIYHLSEKMGDLIGADDEEVPADSPLGRQQSQEAANV